MTRERVLLQLRFRSGYQLAKPFLGWFLGGDSRERALLMVRRFLSTASEVDRRVPAPEVLLALLEAWGRSDPNAPAELRACAGRLAEWLEGQVEAAIGYQSERLAWPPLHRERALVPLVTSPPPARAPPAGGGKVAAGGAAR